MKYLSSISNGKDIANKDYIDNKIPTKTSQLTNDSSFITNTGDTSGNAGTATTLKAYGYNRNNNSNTWFKVATVSFGGTWQEKHAFLFIKGTHNSNYKQNGIIAIDAVGNGNAGVVGSYAAQFMSSTDTLDLTNFYIEFKNGDASTNATVNFWVRANTNGYAGWQIKILQNSGWTVASSNPTATTLPSSGFTGKNAERVGSVARSIGDKNGADITTTYYKASNPNGYTSNTGTITGITMNGASKGTSGVVDLGTVITQHQDISGKANISDLATVATSGSYSDLSGKPDEGITVLTDSNIYIYNLDKGLYRMPGAHHAYYGASDVINSDYGAYLFITDSAITEDQHQWRQFIYLRKDRQCMGFARDDRGAVNDRFLTSADIEDSLTSTSASKTLSANQGYVLDGKIANKQDTLVSGTNIKTINNTNLLGSGNLEVQNKLVSGTNIKTINGTNILGSGDLNLGVITTRDWSKTFAAAANTMTTGSVDVPTVDGYTCIGNVLRTSSSAWMIYELAANGYVKIWNHGSSSYNVTLYGKFIFLKNT